MVVQLTTTSKRENSTAIPSMSYSTQCRLKAPSSIMTPVLMFDRENLDHEYNYIYIPDFNRYYWVTDVVYAGALIEYRCRIDVLASYKTTIGNSTQYVLRSASLFNGDIVDNMYPLTTQVRYGFTNLSAASYWYEWGQGRGWWSVGIAGNDGIRYYAMNWIAFTNFMRFILSDNFVTAILHSYVLEELYPQLKMTVDPLQYITSVVWLPFLADGTTVTSLSVGNVTVEISQGVIKNLQSTGLTKSLSEKFTLQLHPLTSSRGEYLNSSGFTSCTINYPPFGNFDLDVMRCIQAESIGYVIHFDLSNGGAVFEVCLYDENNRVIDVPVRASAQIGLQIPVSQVIAKGWNALGSIASFVGGIAGSTDKLSLATNAIGGVINGIGDYAEGKIPKVRTNGSRGDLSSLSGTHNITYEWTMPVDDDNTQHGRPLCELVQINTLSGYILCAAETEIQITGTAAEEEQIRAYMEGGFYYE